jgi:hypothetical protein
MSRSWTILLCTSDLSDTRSAIHSGLTMSRSVGLSIRMVAVCVEAIERKETLVAEA